MFNKHVDVQYPTDTPEHFDPSGNPESSCMFLSIILVNLLRRLTWLSLSHKTKVHLCRYGH